MVRMVHMDKFLKGRGLFIAIYQGYNGCYVADLCARVLHKEVKSRLQHDGCGVEKVKAAFDKAYQKIDEIQLYGGGETPFKRWSGCSAVTCLVIGETLYVANAGSVKGFILRGNHTLRCITSSHDLYNRKERLRVRKNGGLVLRTEKCALVNGVLDTTRGLGNQGDRRLKVCVINKPRFRAVNLQSSDKLLVLASEGVWKVFGFSDVVFLLSKYIQDALCKKLLSREDLLKMETREGIELLTVPPVHLDSEYEAFLRQRHVSSIDNRWSSKMQWKSDNPAVSIRRAPTEVQDSPEPKDVEKNSYFTETEQEDEDLQALAKLLISFNADSSFVRREIARLLSKHLLKCALLAGAETNNGVIIIMFKEFDLEEFECKVE